MKDAIIFGFATIAFMLAVMALSAAIGFGLSAGYYAGKRMITTNDNMEIMSRLMNGRR